LDLEGEERQAAIDDWALCRQNYRVGKARARARMVEARGEGPIGSGSVSPGMPAVRSSNGRLPEITLPKFTGKVLEFPSFWAQFEANVHKRRDLDNATKFTYLLSNTDGTARNAIEGIPLTPENYSQAVDILKKRFGRPRQVIREHLAALWREPACREMTAQGIQSLVDEVTKHLRCLTALDKDPFAGRLPASEVLMPMLLDKFPPALIGAWDTNIGPDAAEEEDNLQKFLEFAQWQAGLLSKSRREETKPSASRPERRTPSSKPLRPERRSVDRIRSTAAALAVVVAKDCPFCSGGHKAEECEKFQQADLSRRRDMARTKEVCFRCLETGHMAKGCREGRPCGVDGCRQLHHKLLHPSPTTESPRSPRLDRAHQGLLAARGAPGGSLQTVRARAYGPDGNHVLVNCLFDTGAEASFIRKDVAEVLGLTGPHERCRFTTLGGRVGPERKWRRVEFWLGAVGSSGRTEASTRVQALAIPRVCGKVQSALIGPSDGTPTEPGMGQLHGTPLLIDVLIGIDYYYEFVTGRIRRTTSGTVAVETRLGWLVCGRTDPRQSSEAQVLLTKGEGPADDILRRFWEIESLGIAPAEDTAKDEPAEMMKLEEDLRMDDGRYSVSLPWLPGGPDLPNNYSQARRRLLALERRLGMHEGDRVRYASVMKQYLDEGWAESAPAKSPPRRTWYLPHHAVYQGVGDQRKCRVVFDGAAQYNGTTLNSQLEAGPNLQIDLLRAILSFRRLRVGLQVDIEKMYLQIRVRPEDRDACRFLWRDDERKIRKYRLTRVCFGLTCSPFLAMGTVRSHVRRHQASAPRAAGEVLTNMYMDDLATSCDSVADAQSLADQLGSLLASGGFRLHKWASNEPDALRELPAEKTAMGEGGRPWKTLGIYWQRDDDHLTFAAPEGTRLTAGDTKRRMLSTASGIFDPIGCLAPFLVRAKILFQSLWETGVDWDEPLPEEVNRLWIDWKRELDDLPLVRFPRALVSVPLNQAKRIELHAFCDASERAYGAVVYLRVETAFGSTRVNLVAAKTRVSPVKRLSLPRLELMGALTAARLIRFAQEASQLGVRSLFCWSDSEVTLAWVRSASSRWKPFVRNRVEEIQRLVEPTCWRHCPGKDNPADLLSRGSSLKGLARNSRWWQGPRWLSGPAEGWPRKRGPSDPNSLPPLEEARASQAALLVSVVTHAQDDVLHPSRYGDIEKLFRITALCLRFAKNCTSAAGERRGGPLTAQELDAAEQIWVRIAQGQGFRKEIDELRANRDVAARSPLRSLSPFLDEAGTLRVGGRLEKSHLPVTEKHPAILPSENEITRGLILRCHLRQLHAGVTQTLATLRQRYWVLQGRSCVRHIIRGCLQCRWATARPTQPRMAALPEIRTTPAPAFAHVGMDFAGPLFVKATRKTASPRYVCLMTCMVSRAVHLELVPEMSTVGVMQALRRFMARRGRPATIQTDNFRSFRSAASELRRLWEGVDVDQVQSELAGQRIQWIFNPPRAPWMGGYWERLIRSVKESLRKVLGQALLDDEELRTILCEVEACLNARPLTLVEERPEGPVPLSPFQLLTGRAYMDFPEVGDPETDWRPPGERSKRWESRWRYRQQLIAKWWRLWRSGYLSTLLPRRKWTGDTEGPKLNDLVLILEDNVPRGRCPLGVVVELFPGGDGVARAARLRTSTAEMTRPVAKLVVLEPARVSDGRTIANGGRTIPAHRRPDRYLGIWQPRSGSERPRALTLTDDNGCLRHCAGCQQGTLKKPPDGRARQMAIARSKKAEGAAAY
ncbi:hypothetical protein T12_7757, partial [Trichinella patagoniensis]